MVMIFDGSSRKNLGKIIKLCEILVVPSMLWKNEKEN